MIPILHTISKFYHDFCWSWGMMPSDGQLSQSVCARRALLKLRFLLIMPAAGAGKIYSGFIFAVVDTVYFNGFTHWVKLVSLLEKLPVYFCGVSDSVKNCSVTWSLTGNFFFVILVNPRCIEKYEAAGSFTYSDSDFFVQCDWMSGKIFTIWQVTTRRDYRIWFIIVYIYIEIP